MSIPMNKHHNLSHGKCQWFFKSSLSPWHRWFGRRSDPQWLSQRISFWNSTHPTGRSIEHTWWCLGCMVKSFHWRLSNIKKASGARLGRGGCGKYHNAQGVNALEGWNMWHVVMSCQLRCWIPFTLMGAVLFASESYTSDFDLTIWRTWSWFCNLSGWLTWDLCWMSLLKARLLGWTRPTTTFCQSLGWRTYKLQRGATANIHPHLVEGFGSTITVYSFVWSFPTRQTELKLNLRYTGWQTAWILVHLSLFLRTALLQLLQDVPTLKKGGRANEVSTSQLFLHGTFKAYSWHGFHGSPGQGEVIQHLFPKFNFDLAPLRAQGWCFATCRGNAQAAAEIFAPWSCLDVNVKEVDS